jgi:hypothetical protein
MRDRTSPADERRPDPEISDWKTPKRNSPSPSATLSSTLPTKPSVTTTSHIPRKMLLPSTFPTKFARLRLKSACTSRANSFPFLSSDPMFIRPTRGLSIPYASLSSAEPMIP